MKPAQSYRGAGVVKLKLGNYEEAITYFNDALKCDKVGKALKKIFCRIELWLISK
ncbi:tetratricopeptide repeat protein [Blautia wexlerae]|nr:tetratricopeptide repeat protein [Blautia wexlerae]